VVDGVYNGFSTIHAEQTLEPIQETYYFEAFRLPGIGHQHGGDMRANSMFTDGTGANRFLDLAFNYRGPHLIALCSIGSPIAKGTDIIATAISVMNQALLNVLHSPIELRFSHPGMNDVLRNRAVLSDSPIPLVHYSFHSTWFHV